MRVWLTGRYRVLWGTRYWNPYPTLTMDPDSHPDHKTNQTTKQPTKYPAKQLTNPPTNQVTNYSTNQPTNQPTTIQPANQPNNKPINQPNNQAILLLGQCTGLETWKGMPLKGRQKSDPLGYDESMVDRSIPGFMGNQVLEPLSDPNHGP